MLIEISGPHYFFSACHFLATSKISEALHGHNFMVSFQGEFQELTEGLGPDFEEIAQLLQKTLGQYHHKILLATQNPYYQVIPHAPQQEIEVIFNHSLRHYLFPQNEVKLLAVPNISTEHLATNLQTDFITHLKNAYFTQSELRLEEAPGMAVRTFARREDFA